MVFSALAAACSSSDDAGGAGSYCAAWNGKERECGLRTPGRTNCVDYYDAAEPCETRCISQSTCADFTQSACSPGTNPSSTFLICSAKCIGLQPVTCRSGAVISGYTRCNGDYECGAADDTDEASCPVDTYRYKCRTVDEYVASAQVCDEHKDCSDGSDEHAGCKTALSCQYEGSTIELQPQAICDGFTQCDDGRDEPSDCAGGLTCPVE